MKVSFQSENRGIGAIERAPNSTSNNVPIKIAFTGHRDINPGLVDSSIHKWLVDLKVKYPNAEIITGGAVGVDAIVAKHAIAIGFNVHIFLPCPVEQFTSKWQDWQREQLWDHIFQANEITCVCREWHSRCYTRRNEWMAKHADVVIGFYDGRRHGGTKHMMFHSFRIGKRVINGFTRKDWRPADTPAPPEPPSEEPEPEEFEIERTYLREIFYTNADIHGECHMQVVNKVEEIGLTQYRFYNESADFDPKDEAVLERHEILTASDEYSLAAKIKQQVGCDTLLAKDIATWLEVVDPDDNLWDYWITGLRYNRREACEQLEMLYRELAQEQYNPEDALEHPELLELPTSNNRVIDVENADATYGWHRIDWDDWDDIGKPEKRKRQNFVSNWNIKPSEDAQKLITRIQKDSGQKLRQFGKRLYLMNHDKMKVNLKLNEADWTLIWQAYQETIQANEQIAA